MQVPITRRYLAPPPGKSALSALFYGELKRREVKCYEIEVKLGVSPNTLRKWLQHPEDAPLKRLIQIAKILGIDKTKFCQTMAWKEST